MKVTSKHFVAAALLASLAGCGNSDESPVIKGKDLNEIGEFIEESDLLTPGQINDLKIAIPNLMNEWVIKHGLDEDYKKNLTKYFDGMHVDEAIKKGGTKPNLGARADAERIASEYRAKHPK
ncbi:MULTISPECIES: hypothetical protein [Pseudomonas]|uniref:Lipoprotein n=1 Tax=Pseudomonas helleri TaxID=1608996 RepID=A0A6L5HWH2_9PSED|nr:hypothetical protein [Pseudomonas helleri]MQU07744.1 hypothetical protein [Pseudomonas helleri]